MDNLLNSFFESKKEMAEYGIYSAEDLKEHIKSTLIIQSSPKDFMYDDELYVNSYLDTLPIQEVWDKVSDDVLYFQQTEEI